MDSRQNSVRYDPEQQELKIITCYNKLQYKALWIQGPYLRCARYIFYARDREVNHLPSLRGFWAYFWGVRLVALAVAVYITISAFLDYDPPSLWMVGASLVILFCLVRLRALWMRSYKRVIHRTRVPKLFRRTWEGIDRGFADRPVFRQEVTITPEGHSLNTPYPDLPAVQCRRGEYCFRVVKDEADVYFLQFRARKRTEAEYMFPAGLHFTKSNYSDADWTTLVTALQEMGYL